MGGCTAYVKCCMCDDSVGHKHAITRFEELLTSRVKENKGKDAAFVVRVDADEKVSLMDLNTALGELEVIKDLHKSKLIVTDSGARFQHSEHEAH